MSSPQIWKVNWLLNNHFEWPPIKYIKTVDPALQLIKNRHFVGEGGPEQLSTPVDVIIHIEDVNDSPPAFTRNRYSSVVPENSPINTLVVQVTATDPDLGESGQVFYSLVDASLSNAGSYRIDENTGEIFTNDDFTGKGKVKSLVE